jgi:general secretion pathway protein M
MKRLHTYWNSLNEREQVSLGLGGIVGIVYLFYLCIYSPLTTAVITHNQQLQEKRETLAWMEKVAQQANSKTPTTQAIDNSKLLSLLASELKKPAFSPFPYQLQQTASNDIQLQFDKIPYSTMMLWLWDITHRYRIHIKEIHIEQTASPTKPGLVKLHLLLFT